MTLRGTIGLWKMHDIENHLLEIELRNLLIFTTLLLSPELLELVLEQLSAFQLLELDFPFDLQLLLESSLLLLLVSGAGSAVSCSSVLSFDRVSMIAVYFICSNGAFHCKSL
jgi:hypothetical protein